MSTTLQRIIIACEELDAMAAFYQAVFDCAFERVETGEFHFYNAKLAGTGLCLFPSEVAGIDADENRHQLVFGVESLEAVTESGTAHGGTIESEIRSSGDARVCCLRDPDGNTIEFVEQTL